MTTRATRIRDALGVALTWVGTVACVGVAAGAGNGGDATAARRVVAVPGWADRVEVVPDGDDPAVHWLVLGRDLPNPGWDLRLERVESDDAAGTIVVSMVEVPPPPDRMFAQVITAREVRVPLGRLPPGRYLIDLRCRTEGQGDAVRVGAMVVAAFER